MRRRWRPDALSRHSISTIESGDAQSNDNATVAFLPRCYRDFGYRRNCHSDPGQRAESADAYRSDDRAWSGSRPKPGISLRNHRRRRTCRGGCGICRELQHAAAQRSHAVAGVRSASQARGRLADRANAGDRQPIPRFLSVWIGWTAIPAQSRWSRLAHSPLGPCRPAMGR
jgi:hypothetical protein